MQKIRRLLVVLALVPLAIVAAHAEETQAQVGERVKRGLAGLGYGEVKTSELMRTTILEVKHADATAGGIDVAIRANVYVGARSAALLVPALPRGKDFEVAPGVKARCEPRTKSALMSVNARLRGIDGKSYPISQWTGVVRASGIVVIIEATYTASDPATMPAREEALDAFDASCEPRFEALCGKVYDALGATKPGELQLELLDANPGLNGKFDFTDVAMLKKQDERRHYELNASTIAAHASDSRTGTTADGVSLLVVRASVERPGEATFELDGDASGGTLHPIVDDFDLKKGSSKLKADTWTVEESGRKNHFALALYRPPATLGTGRGLRKVRLKLTFAPGDKSESRKGERGLTLVRPPVVLVHGTFDNPRECWAVKDAHADTSMEERLQKEGFRVFKVDWEETNGHTDPSSFATNRQTVWKNRGGIKEAVEALRKDGFAATQADLVCHSQGGVIARVYAKGTSADKLADDDFHYTDPHECSRGACFHHRPDNFAKGDIHRLITISTTHYGSDCSAMLAALVKIKSEGTDIGSWDGLCSTILLLGAGYSGSSGLAWAKEILVREGQLSGGVKDQVPESEGLRAVGKTVIPSHAIACTCEDEDMMDCGEEYQNRMELVWTIPSRDALVAALKKMGQADDAADIGKRKDAQEAAVSAAVANGEDQVKVIQEQRRTNARRLRAAVFGNCPNDCTVRRESSQGGLPEKYTTTLSHVLHGYAPRYTSVQNRVVELLVDDGGLFCAEGFPPAGKKETNQPWKEPAHPAGK